MVLCCVVVCSKRSGRDNVKFFRIPAVITHRGEQERELSERRRREFLAAIGRADLKGTKRKNLLSALCVRVAGKLVRRYERRLGTNNEAPLEKTTKGE